MDCGDTLLMPTMPGRIGHLYILVTKPEPDGLCVIVNVTTLKDNQQDQTVVLQKGDHSFIKFPSVISFNRARFANANVLLQDVEHRSAKPKDACSALLLQRIQKGILASTSIKAEFREYCKRRWGIR